MNMIEILEKFGVPITMCIAFGFFIWKQNKWIQDDLKKDMDEQAKRLENIVIGLINALKKHTIDVKEIRASYASLVNILERLIGKVK